MKIFLLLFFSQMLILPAYAQVGRISADGDVSYAVQAQDLKRQRGAEPTYEQMLPQNTATSAAEKQQAAQQILEDEVIASDVSEPLERKKTSVRLAGYGDQREARNLMVVRAVANYKLGDEKLAKQFEKVEDNIEFERKMQQIMDNLSNNRLRNAKNREAVRILDDAGNKLYNLLAN